MKNYIIKIYGRQVGTIYANSAYSAMLKGSAAFNKGNTSGVSVCEI